MTDELAEDEPSTPEATHGDPAPQCPVCSGPRYWSDYWTDQLVALCVRCEAARQEKKP